MKLSVLVVSTIFLLLVITDESEQSFLNSVATHVKTRIGKVFHTVGDTIATGYNKIAIAVGVKDIPQPKKHLSGSEARSTRKHSKHRPRFPHPPRLPTNPNTSSTPKRSSKHKNDKIFNKTDEFLAENYYKGMSPSGETGPSSFINNLRPKNQTSFNISSLRTHAPYPIFYSDGSESSNKKGHGGAKLRKIKTERRGHKHAKSSIKKVRQNKPESEAPKSLSDSDTVDKSSSLSAIDTVKTSSSADKSDETASLESGYYGWRSSIEGEDSSGSVSSGSASSGSAQESGSVQESASVLDRENASGQESASIEDSSLEETNEGTAKSRAVLRSSSVGSSSESVLESDSVEPKTSLEGTDTIGIPRYIGKNKYISEEISSSKEKVSSGNKSAVICEDDNNSDNVAVDVSDSELSASVPNRKRQVTWDGKKGERRILKVMCEVPKIHTRKHLTVKNRVALKVRNL